MWGVIFDKAVQRTHIFGKEVVCNMDVIARAAHPLFDKGERYVELAQVVSFASKQVSAGLILLKGIPHFHFENSSRAQLRELFSKPLSDREIVSDNLHPQYSSSSS